MYQGFYESVMENIFYLIFSQTFAPVADPPLKERQTREEKGKKITNRMSVLLSVLITW